MEYDEDQIDDSNVVDDSYNLKMIVMLLMSWRWWWCRLCGHEDNEGGDGVVSYHTSNMLS